jgi:hypothetical protein
MVLHLVLTYLFTFLALRFVYQNYQRFIRSRQLYSLELAHSIAARTVMVTDLPNHLQGERALAEYFENMNLPVESVSIGRDVGSLKVLIEKRTNVLLALEKAWTDYVGNPTSVESYDPSLNVRSDATDANLIDLDTSANRLEAQPPRLVVPHRPRPTLRPSYFGKPVDALEYLQERFQEADEAVRKKRRSGKFKATHVAFVTFETMSSAVCGVLHLFLTRTDRSRIANCLTSCPRTISFPMHHLPSPRTPRYRMVEYDTFAMGHPYSRYRYHGRDASPTPLLAYPHNNTGVLAELQRNQEGRTVVREID